MEKVQLWGIVEVVLGVLVIAAFICPSIWSNFVLGILVLAFGILVTIHGKPKTVATTSGEKNSLTRKRK
ncbi:MAG: hypothetical protein DRN04_15615 [Thermoprotei archaeon]|nr:MAG: hypothetical protein DRN04_15615 [Thermoprotei archaeon]